MGNLVAKISFSSILIGQKVTALKVLSWFLAPLAVGQRAYVMVRCPSCVSALTFSLNIFFSETTYRILMKFHRNVPIMDLFRIS